MKFFIDANVIFDFIEIGRLDLLVRLYNTIYIIPRIDSQIELDRDKFEAWRENFPVIPTEPELETCLARMKVKYGRGVGEADRAAAIAAKFSEGILLTRDGLLIGEAIDHLGMSESDFIGTVEILCTCVSTGFLTKAEALRYCDDISEKRCPLEDLDRSPIEALPD